MFATLSLIKLKYSIINKNLKEFSIIIMKKFWSILFLVVASSILIFSAKQDALAKLLWQKYHLPNTAILLNQSDADLAMLVGSYHFNGVIGGGEYNLDIAEKAYKKAVSINPKILWGHYQLARIYFVKGDSARALEEINQELEANPENLRSLYVRGLISGYTKNFAGAEKDFRRFTLWAPKEWAGYNDLAWILAKEGKYAETESAIKKAFQEIP